MKYEFLMGLETPLAVNFALRDIVVSTGGIEAVEDYYKTLDSISAQDVRAAAAKFLVDTGRTTVTLESAKEGN
jgi:zinc protease